jgi:hypothetical protein
MSPDDPPLGADVEMVILLFEVSPVVKTPANLLTVIAADVLISPSTIVFEAISVEVIDPGAIDVSTGYKINTLENLSSSTATRTWSPTSGTVHTPDTAARPMVDTAILVLVPSTDGIET